MLEEVTVWRVEFSYFFSLVNNRWGMAWRRLKRSGTRRNSISESTFLDSDWWWDATLTKEEKILEEVGEINRDSVEVREFWKYRDEISINCSEAERK